MTGPAPSCFTQDNTRADGFSGAQIYNLMTTGPGTGSAQAGATAATALERTYAGIEARLKRVGETLGESWTGASADAAQAAGSPINQAMMQMQDALRQADHSLSNQVYQFNYNKGQLKNMPASKPETGFWDDVSPWDTDTEDAVNSYNAEEAHNRKVYSEFQSASNTNRGDLPKEFPGVTADSLQVEVVNTGGDDGRDKTADVNNTGRPTGTPTFPSSTGSPQGTTGSSWTGPGSLGDQTNTSWVGGGNDGTGGTRPGPDIGNPGGKPPAGGVIERPPNTGLPPIGLPGGPGLGGGGGRGGGGGGAGAGKFGGGGAGGGRFGGGGGGIGGVGAGSGSAAQQPGGKAGVFGGMGESGPNSGARGGAAAGAAGRAGAAGMGGMGGHGQKGQGEDDLEHKTADYLITEENTNEIIGDMPMVAPPTIGG
ncbi:PPE family protein [Lentzea xinjiangensis]|uniref:PPE family protein n=1 Tax=Lentzea xinjiangensis TaxID=402600 RepID=A0A1H9TJH0_9PSEU|nr:PPE domain-containing protein [Lentzea xinjiangensis]SER96743.1 PPE family protein [Lentzea xinjiangensis]